MCVACLVSVSGSNQYLLRLMTDFLASQMFLFVLIFFWFLVNFAKCCSFFYLVQYFASLATHVGYVLLIT